MTDKEKIAEVKRLLARVKHWSKHDARVRDRILEVLNG